MLNQPLSLFMPLHSASSHINLSNRDIIDAVRRVPDATCVESIAAVRMKLESAKEELKLALLALDLALEEL